MTVVKLRRAPAYTPMGPPVQCMTPGHEDTTRFPARPRAGGRLCDDCIRKSRQTNSSNKGAS